MSAKKFEIDCNPDCRPTRLGPVLPLWAQQEFRLPLFSRVPRKTIANTTTNGVPSTLVSIIMHLAIVSLFVALYASIVAATAGQMGFSLGVEVNPFQKRALTF
jgi:hypothetical protein